MSYGGRHGAHEGLTATRTASPYRFAPPAPRVHRVGTTVHRSMPLRSSPGLHTSRDPTTRLCYVPRQETRRTGSAQTRLSPGLCMTVSGGPKQILTCDLPRRSMPTEWGHRRSCTLHLHSLGDRSSCPIYISSPLNAVRYGSSAHSSVCHIAGVMGCKRRWRPRTATARSPRSFSPATSAPRMRSCWRSWRCMCSACRLARSPASPRSYRERGDLP